MSDRANSTLDDDQMRRELQIAFEQADRSEWRKLDIEEIITEARRRHSSAVRDE